MLNIGLVLLVVVLLVLVVVTAYLENKPLLFNMFHTAVGLHMPGNGHMT